MPKRCALGCLPLGVTCHVFPHPERYPETFKAWVKIVGGKLDTTEDYEFYRKKIICDIHFTDTDKNRNNRLNALAVPTLHLPDRAAIHLSRPSLGVGNIRRPLGPIQNLIDQPLSSSAPILDLDQPSTSLKKYEDQCLSTTAPVLGFTRPSASEKKCKGLDDSGSLNVTQPSTSNENIKDNPLNVLASLGIQPSMEEVKDISSVLTEHNYCKQKNNKAKGLPSQSAKKDLQTASQKRYQAELKVLQRKIKRLRNKHDDFEKRLEKANKLSDEKSFRRITKTMTSPAKLFTRMQFTQTHKKPAGRRYTLEQKILSLTIYKKSAKVYNLLSKLFTLPSVKTVRSLLSKIKIGAGLIDVIFNKIKSSIQGMSVDEKLCTLIFDEMALTPQLHYDSANDVLKGFSNLENKKIADHVLVFMIKGVKANYKQPVAYYFTNNINKYQLQNLIKDVIVKLQATGLIVLCTVCDQGTANVGAINDLIQDTKNVFLKKGISWRHDVFEVNKKQVVPIFDVPHLIKGLRNNLLNKDLMYVDYNDNNQTKTVKWEYFLQVCEADKCRGELKLLYKLTEEHLNPEKIKKMRVKNAVQIFSHSVAVVTDHLSEMKLVNEDCRQIIPFVTLVDNLFDSLNSSTLYVPDGKIYKRCVKPHSPHHQLWQKAIKTFKTMKFITKKKTHANKIKFIETVTPTVKNFIKTLQGMQVLWNILSQKYLLDCMLTRHFNQDPLENFFGSIRSYGVRNTAPNCVSFEGAYKALLVNNFSSPHSLQANCEKDTYTCLQNLQFFLKEKPVASDDPKEDNLTFSEDVLVENVETDLGQRDYVCGWVLTKCLKSVIKGCQTCKRDLLSTENEKIYSNKYIRAKEYNKNKHWLVYPSENFKKVFEEIQHITVCTLKKDVPQVNLKNKIKLIVETLVYFPGTCRLHSQELKKYFVDVSINILIYSWCRSINRILVGKISYDGDDEIKIWAQDYHNKHKHSKINK